MVPPNCSGDIVAAAFFWPKNMKIIQVQDLFKNNEEHARLPHRRAFLKGSAYVNHKICPVDKASIPITDLGFTRADAVYDVVTVSKGKFFKLEEHQKRFANSLTKMKLNTPFDFDEEAELFNKLVALTGLKDAYLWWGVTRGETPSDSSERLNPDSFQNRYFAYVIPYIFIANDAARQKGINIWISQNFIRIPKEAVDPRAKNLCSLDLAMSLIEAGENQAQWSVLTDGNGHLMEAPGSNIFIIKDGVAATPDDGCLEGITRQTALELFEEVGVPVEVRKVSADELTNADEAFLTSSAGGIMPVSSVNGLALPSGAMPAPITVELHNLYWEKRWAGWHARDVDYSRTGEGLLARLNPFR